jgi:1-acyl-sn-glycerol-3-phosphate acyltransferase
MGDQAPCQFMSSLKAIPVYRGSTKILSTMRQTVAALKDGESVLISPDIDYLDNGSGMGVMHEGFLHIDRPHRAIHAGDAIRFPGRESFRIEKDEEFARIKREFSKLEQFAAMAGETAWGEPPPCRVGDPP